MRVLVVQPNIPPYVQDIENSLEAMQAIVGGYIEAVRWDNFVIICDEEGRLKGKEYNRSIAGYDFVGTFFICGTDGEEFRELEDKEIVLLKYGKALNG